MGSFDWGSALRRTVGALQPSVSNEYKLLKAFSHISVNLCDIINLYLNEFQNVYRNDTYLKL